MGGRGAASATKSKTSEQVGDLPYTIINYDDPTGGAIYPFLEQTKRSWRILTMPVGETAVPHPSHTFVKSDKPNAPTLRWVNGDKTRDLYVEGMSTTEFLDASGLKLSMQKGGFVLSKRLSRLMRPHFVSGFFEPADVNIGYLKQTDEQAKVWDGAGLISRRMLRKFMLNDDLSPAKREQLERELKFTSRVEFTVMTPKGQDKGHAIVADNLRDDNGRLVDFLLPEDTKTELRLVNGRTFVGLNVVHGHNDMRLDIQSLINLHPFFKEEHLTQWLKDEGDLFTYGIESGQIAEVMGRIDRHTALDELQAWPLREYLASGGHPMWFRSHVKGLMNQHLMRLNHTTLTKLRLPIPGGRHYVMPTTVGRRAGLQDLQVSRGHIQIDPQRGTAWVNDEDWLSLLDSPKNEGIAGILGGADHDDALWLHPFTDHDGEQKVLAWRSPNQVGEHIILKPTERSHELPWVSSVGADGQAITAVYPLADSRALPTRIDETDVDYLGLVNSTATSTSQADDRYSVANMNNAVTQAIANEGALGMYCNALMLNKALYGRLPANPPAPLEDIIDSAVKTGADLSQVVRWNYDNSRQILNQGTPIPALLHSRLSIDWSDKENRPPPPRSSSSTGQDPHWLDRLEIAIKVHIQTMQQKRDALVAQARPPQAIIDVGQADPKALKLGADLNKTFAAALNRGKNQPIDAFEMAKTAVEDFLSHFPPNQRDAILLGALASVYGKEGNRMDTAVWLASSIKNKGNQSVAHQMIEALRREKVLDDLVVTKEGIITYPTNIDL